MRPQTNSEIAKALRVQSQYATDSETKWLMEEAARRIEAPEDTDKVTEIVKGAAAIATEIFESILPAESAAGSQPAEEQNAPPSAKPQRLPRKKPAAE